MTWMALLSARSPPRLRRWRVVWPLDASMGLVPASRAKAASLRQRPGWENNTMACAALTGPMPGCLVSSGGQVVDDLGELGLVRCQRPGGVRQRQGEAADLALAHRLVPGGVTGLAAAGQA